MLPGQTKKANRKNNEGRGRRPKIEDEVLSSLIEVFLDETRQSALKGDTEIAEIISNLTGINISSDTIYLFRKRHGIASCHGRGGARPDQNGRPKKITDDIMAKYMERFTFMAYIGDSETKRKVARLSDIRIAEIIYEETGIQITSEKIRLYRKEHLIDSCFSFERSAGRCPGTSSSSSGPSSRKKKTGHKLTISDYELVQVCSSAYEFRPGYWNEKTGKYDRLARYVPKCREFREVGLKTYTPVLPFPERSSGSWEDCQVKKTQKFNAIKGQ
ncbi:MAG: hypothetical protein QHH75_04780 [Bacillota bacterium]|nr:hypothetical protein [Bacillota bacterium]